MAVNWDELDDATFDANAMPVDDDTPSRTNMGTWNGKPIPANAVLNDDGTPQLTETGRIKRKYGKRDGSTAKASQGRTPTNSRLAQELLDPLAKIAMALSFTAPTASAVLIERGEKTATALVGIAAGHPKMLAALQRATKVGPAADLVETAIMMAIAVSLDLGRIPPDHPLAGLTGVGALYAAVHPEAQQGGPQYMTEPPPYTTPSGDMSSPHHPMYSFTAGNGASAVTPPKGGPFA